MLDRPCLVSFSHYGMRCCVGLPDRLIAASSGRDNKRSFVSQKAFGESPSEQIRPRERHCVWMAYIRNRVRRILRRTESRMLT